MMREPTFKAFAKPGASEVDVAESADALAQAVIPSLKRMVEALLMLQVRHMFEGEGITPGKRHLKTVTLAMFDRPHPAMGSDDIAHDLVEAAHRGGHDVWLVLPQPHRAVDLRRQQCDGGGSKISGHTQPAPVHQQRIRAWIDAAHASERATAEYGKPSAQTPASQPNARGSTNPQRADLLITADVSGLPGAFHEATSSRRATGTK